MILNVFICPGEENENKDSRVGLGVSLFNILDAYEYDNGASNSIYLTCNIGSKFRLEPVVGFGFAEGYEQYSIGIGAFGIKPISKFYLLYGARFGLTSNETIVVAPAIGGEYIFIKNFSIGSEIQLRGLINEGDLGVLTYTSVIVRFYF